MNAPVNLRHNRDAPDRRGRMTLGAVGKGESLPFVAKSVVERDDVR
jgi:hypothetical protein